MELELQRNDIDYEDIYNINDYEYPYNHINKEKYLAMFNQKEYNKCAEFEIILGVISMIIMVMIVLM